MCGLARVGSMRPSLLLLVFAELTCPRSLSFPCCGYALFMSYSHLPTLNPLSCPAEPGSSAEWGAGGCAAAVC